MSSFVAITNKEFVRGSGKIRTPCANCKNPVSVAAPPPPTLAWTGGGGGVAVRPPLEVELLDDRRLVNVCDPPVINALMADAASSAVAYCNCTTFMMTSGSTFASNSAIIFSKNAKLLARLRMKILFVRSSAEMMTLPSMRESSAGAPEAVVGRLLVVGRTMPGVGTGVGTAGVGAEARAPSCCVS